MHNKTIDFDTLRKKKGIGLRYFLLDLPKELIGSVATGLTGGVRVLQVGGLVAGFATAAGVATTLGVLVVGIGGGVFTLLGIGFGIFNLVKQSRDREKRIEKIVGEAGSIEKLKKELATLAKNLTILGSSINQVNSDNTENLRKLLFSLQVIKGATLKDKLYNLYGISDEKNLACEMSLFRGDEDDKDLIEKGLVILENEFKASIDEVKLDIIDLHQDFQKIEYQRMYEKIKHNETLTPNETEFRNKLKNLIKKLSQLPGENFNQKLGYLYGLDEESSKDLMRVFNELPLSTEISYENILKLNDVIKHEARSQYLDLLISLNEDPSKTAVVKKKMKAFEKTTLSLIPGRNKEEKLNNLFEVKGWRGLTSTVKEYANKYQRPNSFPKGSETWGEALILAKESLDNYPHKRFGAIRNVLENGLTALVGSLSGFGIIVGIAGLAGVGIATGGIGLALLIVALVGATVGAVLFVAATENTKKRRKQFESEDNVVSSLVDNTTKKVENLNAAMRTQINSSFIVSDENENLREEIQRLRAENAALKRQAEDQRVHTRGAQNIGLFSTLKPGGTPSLPDNPDPNPHDPPKPGGGPPPPDHRAPDPPDSPKGRGRD